MDDLSIVIPCYQEDHKILEDLKKSLIELGAEVIIVDDGSKDPFPDAIKHGCNYGYGAALMTGIKNSTRPIVMTADGDGQHQLRDIQNLYTVFKMLNVDMIIGVRRLKHEKFHRYIGRKILNTIASIIAFYWLADLNSGLRIFRKDIVLGYHPILCKRFSFTTSLTLSMLLDGYKLEWFPISVKDREHGKSHVKVIKDGFITLYYILRIGFALRTRRIRGWIRRNLFLKSI